MALGLPPPHNELPRRHSMCQQCWLNTSRMKYWRLRTSLTWLLFLLVAAFVALMHDQIQQLLQAFTNNGTSNLRNSASALLKTLWKTHPFKTTATPVPRATAVSMPLLKWRCAVVVVVVVIVFYQNHASTREIKAKINQLCVVWCFGLCFSCALFLQLSPEYDYKYVLCLLLKSNTTANWGENCQMWPLGFLMAYSLLFRLRSWWFYYLSTLYLQTEMQAFKWQRFGVILLNRILRETWWDERSG